MTDKEMAEESLISYRKEPKWAGKMFMQDENTSYKDGFLAGLKAGRPKWHKIANGDLPEAENHFWSRIVLFQTNIKGDSHVGFYDYANKAWYEKLTDNVVFGVITWCEIPKYTE